MRQCPLLTQSGHGVIVGAYIKFSTAMTVRGDMQRRGAPESLFPQLDLKGLQHERKPVRRKGGFAVLLEVTFNNPPINLIDPNTIPQLNALLDKIESDPTLNVVVFKSNDPDFFIAHYDISSDIAAFAALPAGPTGLDPWNDVLVRLSRVPVLTVAALRGRARGAGSEFVLACDVMISVHRHHHPARVAGLPVKRTRLTSVSDPHLSRFAALRRLRRTASDLFVRVVFRQTQ